MPLAPRSWRLPLFAVAVIASALIAGCGSSDSSSPSSEVSFTGDAYSNVDLASTRAVKSQIDSSNVAGLEQSWSMPVQGVGVYGSYASTPVIANGVIYSQ